MGSRGYPARFGSSSWVQKCLASQPVGVSIRDCMHETCGKLWHLGSWVHLLWYRQRPRRELRLGERCLDSDLLVKELALDQKSQALGCWRARCPCCSFIQKNIRRMEGCQDQNDSWQYISFQYLSPLTYSARQNSTLRTLDAHCPSLSFLDAHMAFRVSMMKWFYRIRVSLSFWVSSSSIHISAEPVRAKCRKYYFWVNPFSRAPLLLKIGQFPKSYCFVVRGRRHKVRGCIVMMYSYYLNRPTGSLASSCSV